MIIGIDPGKTGGVAGLKRDGTPAFIVKLPMLDKRVDVNALATLLDIYDPTKVYIEQQNIRPQQQGARTILSNYGRDLAMIEYLGLPYAEVTPAQWNAKLLGPHVAGLTGPAKKERSFAKALQTWGAQLHTFKEASKDGPIEAALIAYYGWLLTYNRS